VTSYLELLRLTERYIDEFSRVLPPGAFVPIFANRSTEAIACSLACIASGRPFGWLNKKLRGHQIAEILLTANADFILADTSGLLLLSNALVQTPQLASLRWLGITDATRSGNESVLAACSRELPLGVSFQVVKLERPSQPAAFPGMEAKAWACCLFTSGSTGRQKGVMVKESDLLKRATTEAAWFELQPSDRLLSILPLSFDVGLNQLMSALIAGACVVVQDSWFPRDILRTIAGQKITGISAVPAIWRDFLTTGLIGELSKSQCSLRYITISGGSLSASEQRRFRESIGNIGVFKTYGQTETFRSASLRPEEFEAKESSVGRAYPGTQVLILDDAEQPCGPGEVGEIVHTGVGMMEGYLGGTSHSAKFRMLPDALGGKAAVFTGDYGYLDDEGYLFLKGRRDGMLKIAGNRVYPEEVAHEFHALPGVRDVEVVAVHRENEDPRLFAFVVAEDPVSATAEAIRQAAVRSLPGHLTPSKIVFLKTIPRLSNGKPDQEALKASACRLEAPRNDFCEATILPLHYTNLSR
jgi:acyl-CoA synthetase (AMP-forming)/AMP-acid ligase II